MLLQLTGYTCGNCGEETKILEKSISVWKFVGHNRVGILVKLWE
jgi:hypothetical protein